MDDRFHCFTKTDHIITIYNSMILMEFLQDNFVDEIYF